MEAHAQEVAGLDEQVVVEPVEAAGAVLLGDAQEHRDRPLVGRQVTRSGTRAMGPARSRASRGDPAPRLLERHLGADDPVAAAAP